MLRRGPSGWTHVGRWDLRGPAYEPGSWLRGTLYPQRCDLSPDGRYLSYFALVPHADWAAGPTYLALSRLPWLTALAAWGTGGTWTRGVHVVHDRGSWPLGDPDEGDAGPFRARYGLAYVRPASYAVERRGGWAETPDSPPASEDDPWDERRAPTLTMRKDRPGSEGDALEVSGAFAAFRTFDPGVYGAPRYRLVADGGRLDLADLQWADWAADGRLLAATVDGRLQIRDAGRVTWELDLSVLEPDPVPPPPDAATW